VVSDSDEPDDRVTARSEEIFAAEHARLLERTPGSKALFDRACRTMPLGVASSFQAGDPYPVYLSHGLGSKVWDVDGTEYVDYHNGFGTMAVGHAHPKVAEAIARAASRGTHFAVTTEATVDLAEELCRRFRLDRVRFANSGTEATMDAIRVARGATGRDVIVKIEGSYHGHHDAVMFSVTPGTEALGDVEEPASAPASKGIPADMARWTLAVPFNDLAAAEHLFAARGSEIACLIIEPVMMNIGIVIPEAGYLAGLKEICQRHGAALIFDEVKCGATIAAGGAIERYGVDPDLACFAKSIGGGAPMGAFGGRAEFMDQIGDGIAQQGTYNGNPLAVAASLAALTEVLTPEAYEHFSRIGARLTAGCEKAITEFDVPAHVIDLGCKGCVSYRPTPLRNYRDFLETNAALFDASWAWLVNRGIFMTPGNEEQWTLSVQHDDGDIDRYVEVFGEFCAALAE
jgi:glutamate-1-semialdehyde 2,1-aminomutase